MATIVVTADAKTKTFNITAANQVRIIQAIERDGFKRDPEDINDFDYFNAWLKNQYTEMVFRTERYAAQQAVTNDPGLIT